MGEHVETERSSDRHRDGHRVPRVRSVNGLDSIEYGAAEIAAGRPVVVLDADKEGEAHLVFAGASATGELVAFMVRHTSGYVSVALTEAEADRLDLPPMTWVNQNRQGIAYTVTVDAKEGIGTGISANDRAHTIRSLADPERSSNDFTRPGHVVPVRARDGGVLVRAGHAEASVELATLAGLAPVGVLCELVSQQHPWGLAGPEEARQFAARHKLAVLSIADLVAYRCGREVQVERIADARLPLPQGEFRAIGYQNTVTGQELIALVHGEIGDGLDVMTRVHSECLTGDVLGSLRCDCGPQLHAALDAVTDEGRGVVLYVRGHEGRGIGLLAKLKAYELQDGGADTVDANLTLGLPADARTYGTGAQVLSDLGIRSIKLLTNNPAKRAGLAGYGIEIASSVPLPASVNPENVRYLTTKRDRMGHQLPELGDNSALAGG